MNQFVGQFDVHLVVQFGGANHVSGRVESAALLRKDKGEHAKPSGVEATIRGGAENRAPAGRPLGFEMEPPACKFIRSTPFSQVHSTQSPANRKFCLASRGSGR